jgi:uncharacterized membrane protein
VELAEQPMSSAEPDVSAGERRAVTARLARVVGGWPAAGASAFALVFWLESLRPTLLPRPASMQGIISALALLVGYGLGGLIVRGCCLVGRRTGWAGASPKVRRVGRVTLIVTAALAVVVGPMVWLGSQNEQRSLVTMTRVGWAVVPAMLVVTLVVVLLLGLVARLVGGFVGWCDRVLARRMRAGLAHVLVGVAVVVVLVGMFNRVVIDAVLGGADAAFSVGDSETEPGVVRPTSSTASGGPGSLVAWDTLGLQGRTWVAGASTPEQLQAFAGSDVPVVAPVRAYAGLESAETIEERADLAVADLERAGGFDREVLVVATATGSGWVNPVASSAIEYQWAGDTAMVSMQYSYLPSWIAFLTDRSRAAAAGRALNDAVYARWSQLSEAERPILIIFGESLGSYGSEYAYARDDAETSVDQALSRSDGALWVGPSNSNPLWSQVTAERDEGSPVWRPLYGDGSQVMFTNEATQFPPAPSDHPTIQYQQHPSDPVTWWSLSTLWAPPEWLTDSPRGPDVPASTRWFPFVTWTQVTGDLIQGFSAPAGHGHNYNEAWPAAWTSVAAPAGWTTDDTARLTVAMAERHGTGGN